MSRLSFELMSQKFKKRYSEHLIQPILNEAGIKEGDIILDFGCGPGGYTLLAAKITGEKGKVYGLDIQPLAGKKLNSYAAKSGIGNIQFINSDCDTDLDDESIDVILFYDTYHMLSEKEKVLKELNRVLKKDGYLSFSYHHMENEEITEEIGGSGLFALEEKCETTHKFKKK